LPGVRDGLAIGGVWLLRDGGVRVDATVRSGAGRSGVTDKGVRVALGEGPGVALKEGEGFADGEGVALAKIIVGKAPLPAPADVGAASRIGERLGVARATPVDTAGAQPCDARTAIKASHKRA
jgi:hypothetical protein